jgi:sulfur relay (sulfurtransferase) complex TusBCD TusD component (DsrE family)
MCTRRQAKGAACVRLGMTIPPSDPKTVFNALRPALYALEQGDQVRIFLSGKGVEVGQIENPEFNVKAQAQKVLNAGGEFPACGACLELRNSEGSEACPLSTLRGQCEIARDSDRLLFTKTAGAHARGSALEGTW